MSRRGEGIYKRKDGRWEARYIHHYEDGKAKYRFLYADTYAEVRAKRNAELAAIPASIASANHNKMTFKDLSDEWLLKIKGEVKESTYTRYERNIRVYLLPPLENQKLKKLSEDCLKGIPRQLLERGGKGGTPLSAKTVSDILCVLKSIIKFAKQNEYISMDESCIVLPKTSKTRADILPEEYRIKIEDRLWDSEETVNLGILFTMYTGIRLGELCGLRWGDIDFVTGIVQISRTIERIPDLSSNAKYKTKVVISEPKTESSKRIIPLPKFLLKHFEKFRGTKDSYIVTGSTHHTEPHQFYLRYKTFLRHTGVPEYTFHTLRHTFATRCVEHGFDTKSLSEILGHSNIGTTLSLYVHPTLEQKRNQMERLFAEF